MNPPKQPQPQTAPSVNYEVTQLDLDAELKRMVKRDGLPDTALDDKMDMRRGDYYTAAIRAYYHGHDKGYNDGLVKGLMSRWPWWVWASLGFAAPFALKFLWKLILVVVSIYNG